MAKFIAGDFGAESGRVMLGTLEQRQLSLEEIHRFPNEQVQLFGHYHWDYLYLFKELKEGLRKVGSASHRVAGIGVDTWGVDYALLSKGGRLLTPPYAYRDDRTRGMMEKAFESVSRREIYGTTGIQFMQLNTIFQLLSEVQEKNPVLDAAGHLLFMPDLFHYSLTGEIASEYTIASTSQLLDIHTGRWSEELFDRLRLPLNLMAEVVQPGTRLGKLTAALQSETGLAGVEVVVPASHDTASAVAAVPAAGGSWGYLSSGTWSLLGVELPGPILSEESLNANFTNEGGYGGTIRFLRNNMGLWLLERCRKEWHQRGDRAIAYDELLDLASRSSDFESVIDPDDPSFMNPPSMLDAIAEFCRKTEQALPGEKGAFVRCIFQSLALKYRFLVDQMTALTGKPLERLHVVGGGSQNRLLNRFTANALGFPVVAGPVEATAIGNILVQAIAVGEIQDLAEGRAIVRESFPVETFEPEKTAPWEDRYGEKKELFA